MSSFDLTGYEDISGDGGLLKKVLQEGLADEGSPQKGDEVLAHYTGTVYSKLTNRSKKFMSFQWIDRYLGGRYEIRQFQR